MSSRFEEDTVYALEGRRLRQIEEIAVKLDYPKPLSWDERRDAANLINLILSEAANQAVLP